MSARVTSQPAASGVVATPAARLWPMPARASGLNTTARPSRVRHSASPVCSGRSTATQRGQAAWCKKRLPRGIRLPPGSDAQDFQPRKIAGPERPQTIGPDIADIQAAQRRQQPGCDKPRQHLGRERADVVVVVVFDIDRGTAQIQRGQAPQLRVGEQAIDAGKDAGRAFAAPADVSSAQAAYRQCREQRSALPDRAAVSQPGVRRDSCRVDEATLEAHLGRKIREPRPVGPRAIEKPANPPLVGDGVGERQAALRQLTLQTHQFATRSADRPRPGQPRRIVVGGSQDGVERLRPAVRKDGDRASILFGLARRPCRHSFRLIPAMKRIDQPIDQGRGGRVRCGDLGAGHRRCGRDRASRPGKDAHVLMPAGQTT